MSQAQTVASPGFDKAPCSRSNSTGKEALKAYCTPLLAEELLCGSILSDYYQFFSPVFLESSVDSTENVRFECAGALFS